ncbi:MAG: T9SS type A sorting domain-containing protein [Cytophagales bacterium]|nr:T9SS type A sorting domain-containing protein [Cytophagales bacterium]MDW8383392.1 T9SS type A sorting domain-containing protein [Flammeovirgaceae bacterium]
MVRLLLCFLFLWNVGFSFGVGLYREERMLRVDDVAEDEKLYSSNFFSISVGYPSVASNFLSFDYSLTDDTKNIKIVISNVLGSEITSIKLFSSQTKLRINLEQMADGIYFYTLYIDGLACATRKFLVRK